WRWVPLTLRSVLLFCLILALAQPKEPTDQGKSLSDGLDIMLVVDASGSMQALDFEWEGDREDRLTVVKRVLSEFITAREADRLGLVAFGNVALTLSPLTLDHNVLKRLLAETSIGMAG